MDNRASGAQRGRCAHTRDAKWQCRAHINASPLCGYLLIGDSLGTLMYTGVDACHGRVHAPWTPYQCKPVQEAPVTSQTGTS